MFGLLMACIECCYLEYISRVDHVDNFIRVRVVHDNFWYRDLDGEWYEQPIGRVLWIPYEGFVRNEKFVEVAHVG